MLMTRISYSVTDWVSGGFATRDLQRLVSERGGTSVSRRLMDGLVGGERWPTAGGQSFERSETTGRLRSVDVPD